MVTQLLPGQLSDAYNLFIAHAQIECARFHLQLTCIRLCTLCMCSMSAIPALHPYTQGDTAQNWQEQHCAEQAGWQGPPDLVHQTMGALTTNSGYRIGEQGITNKTWDNETLDACCRIHCDIYADYKLIFDNPVGYSCWLQSCWFISLCHTNNARSPIFTFIPSTPANQRIQVLMRILSR